ncbi:MAG: KpsF/GutQ family sugar-phosphate isomerase, partial [Bacteroidetes bacterium]
DRPGKLILLGMGKSGLIARKIAATLASTGTPSFFVHPAEAFHGDLGMIESGDVILAISNSGETEEILKLIPFFQSNDNLLISMTGRPQSTLARHARYHLDVQVAEEACPLDLAPTASTTAALVMGDALAIALMEQRGFQPENYARLHPGGSLGRRLLTTVRDAMRSGDLPFIAPESDMPTLIEVMTAGRLGLAIVGTAERVQGIVTDGDLRRSMRANQAAFFELQARDIMTATPVTVEPGLRLKAAEALMMERKISALLVMEGPHCIGVMQMYDL